MFFGLRIHPGIAQKRKCVFQVTELHKTSSLVDYDEKSSTLFNSVPFLRLLGLSLLLVGFIGLVHAQDRVVDSLEAHVLEGQPDTLLYPTLRALVNLKSRTNTDSAVAYAWQLIALSDQLDDWGYRVQARRMLGEVYLTAGMLDSVEQVALRTIPLGEGCVAKECFHEYMLTYKLLRVPLRQRGHIKQIIANWDAFLQTPNLPPWINFEVRRLMAYPLMEMGDLDRALSELKLVCDYAREAGDNVLLCNALGELGTAYWRSDQLDKALDIARERLQICSAIGQQRAVWHTYLKLAAIHFEKGNLDSAYQYHLRIFKEVDDTDWYYAYSLSGLVGCAPILDVVTAQSYADLALDLLNREETTSWRLTLHQKQILTGDLSKYYLYRDDYRRAEEFAQWRLDMVKQHQSDTTDLAADALELLAQTQAAAGRFELAWENFTRFHELKMTMINRNQDEALARTAVEMELAENELARQQAEQNAMLEQQNSTARTRLFITLLAVVAVVLLIVFWAYRRAQIARRLISQKNVQIEQSLAEKEVLLREIHHRVKNNLQIISSLLDKQARKSTDEAVRRLVREGQERIQSMALIHQNLYESDQLSGIDIKSYLRELSENIQRSQAAETGQVKLELNVAEAELDIDTAIPVGLILNELITNCYKYAFQGKNRGTISVYFNKSGERYCLRVSDDGVGFQPEEVKSGRTLGMNLINGLVRQLEGTIEWLAVENGSAVAITFS